MELDKFIENLERIYPKANYFIAKNNPFLSNLPDSNIRVSWGLSPRNEILIETKIDGCAIALQYRHGKFKKSLI